MAMTVNPAATAEHGQPFRDEAIYAFHVDTDLTDAKTSRSRWDSPTRQADADAAHVQHSRCAGWRMLADGPASGTWWYRGGASLRQ